MSGSQFHYRYRGAGLLLSLVMGACSSAAREGAQPSPQPGGSTQTTQGATAKPKGRNYPHTQADVSFMSHMIGHHAQALVMAGWAATHGASPTVRTLAERIVNGQQDEIATMQRWLRDRGQPVPQPAASRADEPGPPGTEMRHGGEHEMHGGGNALMPGMLTDAQMKELDQARGPEFDRLFLTYMIQHHQGAVTMVNDLFGTQGAAREETTFKLANDISVDQSTEIARMRRMVLALSSGKDSP
jgi:uncharacterized protein (DUF305 family)